MVKNLPADAGDAGLICGLGRSPGDLIWLNHSPSNLHFKKIV